MCVIACAQTFILAGHLNLFVGWSHINWPEQTPGIPKDLLENVNSQQKENVALYVPSIRSASTRLN